MDTDTLGTIQEHRDFVTAPLEPKKREALELVCVELGLDRKTFECIEFDARMLRDFEAHEKLALKSPRQKVKALEKVEKIAKALQDAIGEIGYVDRLQLWEKMPRESVPRVNDPGMVISSHGATAYFGFIKHHQASYSFHDGGRVGHIGLEAGKLVEACNLARSHMGDSGKYGGRKSVQSHYARHVAAIWSSVKDSSIKVGRGGSFERLCDAVFKAADVPSNSEGAVRRFLTVFGTDEEPF